MTYVVISVTSLSNPFIFDAIPSKIECMCAILLFLIGLVFFVGGGSDFVSYCLQSYLCCMKLIFPIMPP